MQSSHPEFGQAAGYSQYGFPTTLQSMPGNAAHDMSKQVPAPQSGMYANSGGMSSAAHHHQAGMTGPAPSPQQSSLVNQQQQINRHMSLPGYYTRNNVPRTVPNMGRNPMPTVVNQAPQQPTSQYSHTVQMVPSHPLHPTITPILINNHGIAAQMYSQGRYSQPPYPIMNPSQPMYTNYWSNTTFNNAPHGNANGYYQPHQLPTYSMNPPINTQQTPVATQPAKKRLEIIDPTTGKNIFDASEPVDTPASKDDAHNEIVAQFATQVAQALGADQKTEPTIKASPVEVSRVVQPPVLCPPDVETVNNLEEMDSNNVDVCEQLVPEDVESPVPPAPPCYDKENDLNNTPDSYESKPASHETVSVAESNPMNYNILNEEVPVVEEESKDNFVEDSQIVEKPAYLCFQEDSSVPTSDRISPEKCDEVQPVEVVEENLVSNLENVESASSSIKVQEKNESKKKAKKKKDINKRGESKEGGDMDAFLDKAEELPSVNTPVPATPIAIDDIAPPAPETEELSPVPILDSEILSTIPLPGEPAIPPKTEEIVKESPSEDLPPVVSDTEDKENITEDNNNQSKIVLKYSYKEDQWSPLNPEGKKQYDRDFLLQMQSQPMSLCKPSNLPNLDVIKDKAHIQRLTEVNRAAPMPMPVKVFDPFVPTYARGGNALRPPHPAINRRSQQGRGDRKQKIIVLPTRENIKLHESENAWKPSVKVETSTVGDKSIGDDTEIQKLYKSIRGILNKLTPQKFETLVEQVKNLNIDTEEKLKGVIDLVFEKAIDEPNFSVPYANMCKHLALIRVPLAGGGQVQFRKLLLTKCQKEFEQDRRDELQREERIKAIESADPDKRKELKMEFDEEEKKMRMRQLGNIRFIGELFKLNMLIEPIMHECIKKLLSQSDEESLECLCRLLKTIGKELDEKGKGQMDQYFAQMQKIVDKRLTSSRVRFMLQDVIDLKKNNWVPRRDENNPKTIDQIHKEAEREAREAQQVFQNMSYSKRPPDDRRKPSGRNMGVSEDGWTPTSKSNKGSYSMVDPSKLKLTKPDEVDSIRLGPGGRGPQSWSKGSSGGNRSSADTDVKTALTNRYSALADQSLTPAFENRRGSQRSAASSRESSRGRNSQLPPSVRKTPSTSRERESLIETVKELNRNVTEQKPTEVKKPESQVNGKAADTVAVAALALNGPDLSEDEMERKTKPLIDEFLHNADFEEAIKCVTELASPSTVSSFIYSAINQVLERSSQARYLLGQLLCSLVKKELLTTEQYKKGLSGVLENIDEYALDIPLIWEYMGELMEPMIEDNKLPLVILKDVLEPCIPSLTAGKLVSAVLHCAAKKKGTIKLGELWKESELQWTDFLGTSTNISEFISSHKLEFTVSQNKVIPNSDMSIEEIKTKLGELLETKGENEVIFDWIDAKVPPNAVSEPAFIRALSQEVHKASIKDAGCKFELDQATLKKRLPLLTRYIGHNETLELQALYAVQHLMNDLNQPKGVLRQIFDMLYDDDVITEETFKVWEQSKDPSELEGKAVALLSVRGFFTWLREADSGEDGDDE